jgi:PHP family Zn ribbon phosphoesterase
VRVFHADLHIHTCLSPCAEMEMFPSNIVRLAKERGLDVIAICDHNSAENVAAVRSVAKPIGLAVIGGMEITTQEEVHVLGLFADDSSLTAVQNLVYAHLPGENEPEIFGEQLIMDEEDNVIGCSRRLLIGATDLTLTGVVQIISVVSQLGFIPQGLGLDGIEVSSWSALSSPGSLPVICSSDAHRPGEIGTRCTRFLMKAPTLPEIGMALKRINDRRIVTGQ